jgi:hypothetical protein
VAGARKPVVVGRFSIETARWMPLGALVANETGECFQVARVDPPAGPTGLVTVWGYPADSDAGDITDAP